MKYIKSINEFRTIGFRYSEPSLRFIISFYYSGNINEDDISDILKKLNVKFDSININRGNTIIVIEDNEIKVNGKVDINIIIYNELEIDSILENLSKYLYTTFDTEVFSYEIKAHKENIK